MAKSFFLTDQFEDVGSYQEDWNFNLPFITTQEKKKHLRSNFLLLTRSPYDARVLYFIHK